MGSDRIRAKIESSSSLIPKPKPKQFSFLQPRYQDQVETDSGKRDKLSGNPTPALSHSFGRMSVLPIQPKLTIGEPNDKYEQEADRVASQVVKQINAPSSAQSTQGQSVQRMEEPEEEELQTKPMISPIQRSLFSPVVQRLNQPKGRELQAKPMVSPIQRSLFSPVVQRMDMPEEEEELQTKPQISVIQRSLISPALQREDLQAKSMLQRWEAIGGGEASRDLDSAINSSRGGGQPLEPGLQQSMGQAMGADLSGVRIHADSQSDQLNKSIQARAFTTGQDVFFRQGAYQPGSRGGQELIAHELTHVVQQNGEAVTRSLESLPIKQRQETTSAVGNQVVNMLIHAPKKSPSSIQRLILVDNNLIDDVIEYLRQQGKNLKDEDQESIASYMVDHPETTFQVKDAEDLVLEVEKASSMIKLVGSILSMGLLSREELSQKNLGFVGSMDSGTDTKLAVNVLDVRGDNNNSQFEQEVAEKSMTAENRGSISISLERQEDEIMKELVKYEAVTLTDEEEDELKKQAKTEQQFKAMEFGRKIQKSNTHNVQVINSFKDTLSERALRTVMAIVPKPDKEIAVLSERTDSYESNVPSGKIVPGEGGFTILLLPVWIKPFEPLLQNYNKQGIEFQYVVTKQIQAYYKAGSKGQISVTIDAPDYASEVASLLEKFRYLATHIVTG